MKRKEKTVAASWSGGKDCCLALYRAMEKGANVKCLLNMVASGSGRCCFHGLDSGILRCQSDSMGIPLVQKDVRDDMAGYEKDFKEAVSGISGIGGIVFGDIYLDEHRKWVERVCADMGLNAIEPLWNENTSGVAEAFVREGFEAVVISCAADKFGREFVGRSYDLKMVRELESRGICPCGENGEFHTLVVDGPIFRKKVRILDAEPVLRDGFWKHWALDIRKYA